ncbi:hypothetical protein SBOR_6228 [Sclerotinia borealis F-4128]|uniref:Galactose oxidase n=1 Tax=Sclerotinia borealis (strain F-4128) TaxID=1432307 RepID=W9CBZ9_SCLBF|nr:hypothetical protein SBOR_6228 [Sclerotinia borealis F-4128]
MRTKIFSVLWRLLVFIAIADAQILPYNPTTILLPSTSSQIDDIAFIFLVASESDTRPEFLFLNISSTLSASNLTLEPFAPNLSFLDNSTAFIPTIGTYGDISLLTGSCSTSASTEIWTYTPGIKTAGNGTWAQQTTTVASDVSSAGIAGAEYLSGGFQFSTLVNANATYTDIYIYGGMCPSSSANTSTWQSDAEYSNHMIKLSPGSADSYNMDLAANRGAPVAEAGFTATALTPAYSNTSGIMTQAQNLILLGGHTKGAFINMSQVAIWSLPEESWGFVTVNPPSSTEDSNTELTVKSSVTGVDSRSGHTAVLTEDGSKVIILGGWVGNINQAAGPQLAILELGTGYGGAGNWKWSVPTDQPSGDGFYGHGAAMLPGNVMMVLGGFNITASSNTKRALDTPVQPMFYNATSSTWTSNYTNPAYVAAASRSSASSSSISSKVGLGVGLGIGIAALIAVIVGVGWCLIRWRRRRRERRHEARDRGLRSLSYNAATAYSAPQEMSQAPGYSNRQEQYYDSGSAVTGYESLHTGEYGIGETSSPTLQTRQMPRKPMRNVRGLYQPASTFDPSAAAGHVRATSLGTAGRIHPIYEADEDADVVSPIDVGVALPFGEKRRSDPFKDPVPQNHNFSTSAQRNNRSATTPLSDSPAQEREREIEAWVADWAAADALLHAQAKSHSTVGRTSPSRRANLITATGPASISGEISEDSGRTASNLSERSMAPSVATLSRSGSGSQGTRSNSLRGYITHAMNTITSGNAALSPMPDSPVATNAQIYPPGSSGSENTTSTFNTAHTHSSFPTLQAEGVTLLPRPEQFTDRGPPSPTVSPSMSPPRTPTKTTTDNYIGSPSKNKPNGIGRRGWLGSLRRVFSPEGETAVESNLTDREPSPLLIGLDKPPRRTVSAGAALWRRKQGRGDWEDSEKLGVKRGRSNSLMNNDRPTIQDVRAGEGRGLVNAIDEDDDEWDIERAIEDRVVQVMFTVPKERLRVVNHDVREDMSISEGGSIGGRSRVASASGTLSRHASDLLNRDDHRNIARKESFESGASKGRVKGKGKVSDLVEMMEGRGSPERR